MTFGKVWNVTSRNFVPTTVFGADGRLTGSSIRTRAPLAGHRRHIIEGFRVSSETEQPEAFALEKVRRHIRILVDISRLADEVSEVDRFLDQVAVQVSRAVEINHVKILRYRPREADLFVAAGI